MLSCFVCSALLAISYASPNIIFIVMDDWGYADISAMGAEYETPHLDTLFANSIVLNSHYIGLVCSPSRSQMITGRYAWNFGRSAQTPYGPVSIATFPAGFPTIANLLNEYTEYKSYITGKWHMGMAAPDLTPLYRGFSEFYGFYTTGISYTNKTTAYKNGGFYIDWRANADVDYDTQYQYSTYVTRDKIINIIENHGNSSSASLADKPFFLFAPFQAPHDTLEYVESPNMDNCVYNGDAKRSAERYKYCLNALAVDDAVKDILKTLKTNGLWKDTLIIFTSDNGGNFIAGGCNWPLRGNKMTYYDGGVKVLTFVGGGYVPYHQKGTFREGMIHGVDWVPTFLGLIGSDSLVSQVRDDLQRKLYTPAAKQAALRVTSDAANDAANGTDLFENYLVNNSFDGVDLSQWLLYGDEEDNPRTNLPLSVNDFGGNQTDDVSLVFESEVLLNRYKLMQLSVPPGNTEWCYINYNTNKRAEEEGLPVVATKLLYDLTLDANESFNLMDTIAKDAQALEAYYSKIDEFVHVHVASAVAQNNIIYNDTHAIEAIDAIDAIDIRSSLEQFTAPSRQIAKEVRDYFKSKVLNGRDAAAIDAVKSVEDYNEDDDYVTYLWYEAQAILYEYKENPLFNNYLGCTENQGFSSANPALHDDAFSPFMTFDEYGSNLTVLCVDEINPALLEMYLTRYEDYAQLD